MSTTVDLEAASHSPPRRQVPWLKLAACGAATLLAGCALGGVVAWSSEAAVRPAAGLASREDEASARVASAIPEGASALLRAVASPDVDVHEVERLIEAAQQRLHTALPETYFQAQDGEYASDLAAKNGRWDVVAVLLQAGCPLPAILDRTNAPLLIAAAKKLGLDAVARDVEARYPPLVPTTTASPTTTQAPTTLSPAAQALGQQLLQAVKGDDVAEATHALAEGADPNFADQDGTTPLMAAVELDSGAAALVKLLVKHHATIGLRNQNGFTAVDIAAQRGGSTGQWTSYLLLLQLGASEQDQYLACNVLEAAWTCNAEATKAIVAKYPSLDRVPPAYGSGTQGCDTAVLAALSASMDPTMVADLRREYEQGKRDIWYERPVGDNQQCSGY